MSKRALMVMAFALGFTLPISDAPADIAPPRIEIRPAPAPAPAPKPASAPSAPAPSANASAAAGEVALGKSFTEDPPGSEPSKAPSLAEWKDAPRVALSRDAPSCRAYRVREWVKIHCSGFPAAGVSLLGGTSEGVSVWVEPSKDEGPEAMKRPRAAEAIFPVRRGDGRIFQIAQFGEGYDGPLGWNVAFVISEQWAEGEAAPIIIVR